MIGRVIKAAAVAGLGVLAWRQWQRMRAEDREYASSEPLGSQQLGTTTGMNSNMGARVDQVPAQ